MDTGLTDDPELCKIFIDIFIADRVPENALARKLKGLRCNLLEFIGSQVSIVEQLNDETKKRYLAGGHFGFFVRYIVGKIFSIRPSSYWYDHIDKAVQYNKNSSLYGLVTGCRHYFGEIFPDSVYFPVSQGEFEGHAVPLVHEPDTYLKNLYGDYMQIPPIEKRQKHFVRALKL